MDPTQKASFPDKKKMCHRTGFTQSCRDLLDAEVCQGRWQHVTGVDLNGQGEPRPIDGYGCVDDLVGLLQQSFEYRLVGIQAAVEKRGDATVQMLVTAIDEQKRQHREALSISSFIQEPPPPARNGGSLHYHEPAQLEMIGINGE